ncbi:Uroporphyrinogen-III synthase (end) [Blastococcus saxobsidens DD2]|uniref:Uroporphyrinogen-III synthase (End) n=1 Tax=Blastococcus saxobsidens (strain DD2) TaxID=1146883 RepID=H6RWB2_BLASD|nr:Uroporphyrinogen-III synthase (end) [Blastococcus saxobsidens DD2]
MRGHAAVVDGHLVELAPGPLAVLRELARQPGRVIAGPDLGTARPGGDGHELDSTVSRLRAALGVPLVETVGERGYRLDAR